MPKNGTDGGGVVRCNRRGTARGSPEADGTAAPAAGMRAVDERVFGGEVNERTERIIQEL